MPQQIFLTWLACTIVVTVVGHAVDKEEGKYLNATIS